MTDAMYRGAFGGLWTDRTDAKAIANERFVQSRITRQEFDDVMFWIDNGYLVKEHAIDSAVLDNVHADIQTAVRSGTRQVTFWDEKGKHQKRAAVDDLARTEAKLLDVHHTLASVQQAIFFRGMGRFLEMVFEMPAIAFQSLYFEKGSEQGLHQDTAFVYVDQPLEFVASWIALEDVQRGAGELIYYPASHRLPDRIFASGTKAMLPGDPEISGYSADLLSRCTSAGLSEQRFLPRRGDVLLWAADLAHGGAPRLTAATRRSLVTHYCPANRRPPYVKDGAATRIVLDHGHSVMSGT